MVKRYHDPGDWMQSPTGEFVSYDDYDALAAELAATKARLELAQDLCDRAQTHAEVAQAHNSQLAARLADAERRIAAALDYDDDMDKTTRAILDGTRRPAVSADEVQK